MFAIRQYTDADKNSWDTYVRSHPQAALYHLSGWKNVIEKTYGHKTYYLMATKEELKAQNSKLKGKDTAQLNPEVQSSKLKKIQHTSSHSQHTTYNQQPTPAKLVGLLPLVHIKHFLFGNSLISMPFFDMGGILADNEETELTLLKGAIKLAKKLGANSIELRQINPINSLESQIQDLEFRIKNFSTATYSHKVRMLVDLPDSSKALFDSFKSKLRNQIKKPIKEGLKVKVGGVELINDFYDVFTFNMRDLGSPVHSKTLFRNVLPEFQENTKIVIVYKGHEPVACSLIIGFKDILENPWASSLRQFSRLAPNMLLYWTMFEYACDNGIKEFDFGRSTPGEGTYNFKKQWGAKPESLHWHYVSLNGQPINTETNDSSKFNSAIRYWKKLPVPVTRILGPGIRKYIGL